MKYKKTIISILLGILFLGLLGTFILQNQTIRDLLKQQRMDEDKMRSAYLYILTKADFEPVTQKLEALAAQDRIFEIDDVIEETEQQLEFFTETLLQLNALRYTDKAETSPAGILNYEGSNYPVWGKNQELLQDKIVSARYNLHAVRNQLYYFDGVLPVKDKEFLQNYAEIVRAIDKEIKSWRTFLSRRYIVDDREWVMIGGLMDTLSPKLEQIVQLKRKLSLIKPINISREQAEKIARGRFKLGDQYKLLSIEEHNYNPGELSYRMNFSTSTANTEVMVALSAATGKVMAYYNSRIHFAKGEARSKLSETELRKKVKDITAEQTNDMGERLITFSDPMGTALVVGLNDGLPDLTRRISFSINSEVGKVYRYQVIELLEPDGSIDLKPKLTADQVLDNLTQQKDFLLYNQIGTSGLDGAEVKRMVITYSYFLNRPVLAYTVLLNNKEGTVLLVNAVSGKIESYSNKELLGRLENGMRVE